MWSVVCLLACPLVQVVQGNSRYFANVSKIVLILLLFGVFPAFCPAFSLCLWWIACKYGSISHFKGVFRGFLLLDVYLYGLRSLRGLWGFCTRVELGGFRACCVFAPVFLSFPLCLLSFYVLCLSLFVLWLSCSCYLACLVYLCCPCGFLCFLFPLRTIRKKKGRKVFLRPPLSCCVGLFISP